MKHQRALIPLVLASAVLLSGCSGSGITKDAAGVACAPEGAASKAVEVSGDFGGEVELTSATPAAATELERTVLQEGEGGVVDTGAMLSAAMTYINGASGEVLQFIPETTVVNDEASLLPWAYEAVRCAAVGERTALVLPAEEVLGGPVEDAGIEGLSEGDAMVIVMDFSEAADEGEAGAVACDIERFDVDALPARAEGKGAEAPDGLPEVTVADSGEQTIEIPKGVDPPESLEVATLIEGEGDEVQAGDCVAVTYRGVIWRTGDEFDSSWSRGEPTAFSTDGVIAGFQEALEGQKIGSQVLSVVPADAGYGPDWLEQNGYERDDVMVFVLDILAVADDSAE